LLAGVPELERDLVCTGFFVEGSAESVEEAFRLQESVLADALVCKMALPGGDGLTLIDRLRGSRMPSMPACIVLVHKGMERFGELAVKHGACEAMPYPPDREALFRKLSFLTIGDRLNPLFADGEKVRTLLRFLGFLPHLKGYYYLADAVLLVARSQKYSRELATVVYPEVAKRYGATPEAVERAVRNAIDVAWLRGQTDIQYAFFGNTIDEERGKPTNGALIARLAEALRMEDEL